MYNFDLEVLLLNCVKCISYNCLIVFLCDQSNKREKETPPPESHNNKEVEQPVALEPSEKPKLSSLQPQPPSPPVHGLARRSGGKADRGIKRGLKNKTANTAATDSVAGRGAGDSTVKSNLRVEQQQQQQEPSAKRSGVRTTKTASTADRESTAAIENAPPTPYTQLPSGRSQQMPCRAEDNRSEKWQDEQEGKRGAAAVAPAAASHNNKTQVSL